MMRNKKQQFDDFLQRFLSSLPEDLMHAKKDLEKNIRSALQASFSKMDLVTREEFDVQTELLARTRAALQELEKKIAELEKSTEDQK